MSPERRALIIEALIAISEEIFSHGIGAPPPDARSDIEKLTDAELTVKVANIEALIERAMGTEV